MTIIDLATFLQLPTDEVAKLVREAGPQVCVFPINGTRRWFTLEHIEAAKTGSAESYFDIVGKQHIQIYKMCFEHGLDTLLTPIFGSELVTRGDNYTQKIGAAGMARLATHPDFLSFYQDYKVRVRFYGKFTDELAGTPFAYLSNLFSDIEKQTAQNDQYRLFYGVFANDATETIAKLSVSHFQETGRAPVRRELIEQYYGEYIEPASIFIGFDKFSVFDYPLLGIGEENLYFSVAPSLYMDTDQLRNILYDHLFTRKSDETDYSVMEPASQTWLRNFYRANSGNAFGVGKKQFGLWIPLPQLISPPDD